MSAFSTLNTTNAFKNQAFFSKIDKLGSQLNFSSSLDLQRAHACEESEFTCLTFTSDLHKNFFKFLSFLGQKEHKPPKVS